MRRKRIDKARRRVNGWGSMFLTLAPDGRARIGRVGG
jgi:hypothetical protein